MPRQIGTAGLHLKVTLEESATGSGDAARTIPLNYPISTVIGVWAAASEGGTNLYDITCGHDGTRILMGSGTVSASTTYYVSYNIETHLPVIGYPAENHQGSIMGVTHAMPLKVEGDSTTSLLIADPVGGGDISAYLLGGNVVCTIEHIKVSTYSTDLDIYLYSAAIANRRNMEFEKQTINLLWLSTSDYSELKIAIDTGNVYLVVVENGTASIGTEVFTGVGLDDLTSGGSWSGPYSYDYRVEIDAEGTPDTFRWSKDAGVTWEVSTVDIVGGAMTLDNGVTVTFGATTGHTLADRWDFSIEGIYGPVNSSIILRGHAGI